jgi:hypothetical protein
VRAIWPFPRRFIAASNGIETIDRPADIDLESAPDKADRKSVAFGDESNARVKEGQRDWSMRRLDTGDHGGHGRAVRRIAGIAENIVGFRGHGFKFGGPARRRRDLKAALGKFERHRAANARTRSRDPRNAVVWMGAIHQGTSKNIPLWCDDRRSSSQRGRSFNPWPFIEAA